MIIGIMGTPIESSNLGCMALTYSLLMELEKVSKRLGVAFEYIIFDGSDNFRAKEEICRPLNIAEDKLISGYMSMLYNPLRIIKNFGKTAKMFIGIKKCDCIIDITGGDSFSDIYGSVTFFGRTRVKRLIECMKKPLMLAPQTYGPFQSKRSQKVAAMVIKNASCVLTRDSFSMEVIKQLTGRSAVCCADMAFVLPYEKRVSETDKIKVGINVSKLLYSDDSEVPERNFRLTTDYRTFIDGLISYLTNDDRFEVYMIPHVGLDHEVHCELKKKYESIQLVQPVTNPIEMKSIIGGMDVFVGARMHGAIAAFTTGTACIPTAYSRKFNGLFKDLGYEVLIDLLELDTDKAIQKTIYYIENRENVKEQVNACRPVKDAKIQSMEMALEEWLREVK